MKPSHDGKEAMEFGFTPIPNGRYLAKIVEGTEKYEREDGSFSLGFPFQIITGEMEGKKVVDFVQVNPEESKQMEKAKEHVATILRCSESAEKFESNFPNNDYFDAVVIEAYKLRLPDSKPFWIETELQSYKDKSGETKQSTRVKKIEKYTAGSGNNTGLGNNAQPSRSEPATAPATKGW